VQVVDHHDDDPVAALQVAEDFHQLRTDGQRVGAFPPNHTGPRGSFDERRPGTRQKLVDHSPGQEHLRLLAAGPQQANVPVLGDEARDQAGLSDPRLALDQHHPGSAAAHSLHLGVENRQLARPADEMVHFSSVDTPERLTQTPAGSCSATVPPARADAPIMHAQRNDLHQRTKVLAGSAIAWPTGRQEPWLVILSMCQARWRRNNLIWSYHAPSRGGSLALQFRRYCARSPWPLHH